MTRVGWRCPVSCRRRPTPLAQIRAAGMAACCSSFLRVLFMVCRCVGVKMSRTARSAASRVTPQCRNLHLWEPGWRPWAAGGALAPGRQAAPRGAHGRHRLAPPSATRQHPAAPLPGQRYRAPVPAGAIWRPDVWYQATPMPRWRSALQPWAPDAAPSHACAPLVTWRGWE